jgi:hypothetical protein
MLDNDVNSLGNVNASICCLVTLLPGTTIMFSSAVLLGDTLMLLKRDLMVFPFASHTQQCQGFSLFSFVTTLISSLFLWCEQNGHLKAWLPRLVL